MATNKYTGAFPQITTTTKETNTQVRANMCTWAKKVAANNKFHYVKWKSNVTATHECPVCKSHKVGSYYGWNCIGFVFACWHHGGHLSSKCNCNVISNAVATEMLKSTKSAALATARKRIGLTNIQIITNKGKAIPKSMLKAGDICLLYSGKTYKHMFLYVGNGKLADASSGRADNIKYGVTYSGNYASGTKLAIRYTGTGRAITKTVSLQKNDSRKAEVKKWQKFINWFLGKQVLTVDGEFGANTIAQTKIVQKKLGVTADGIVGPTTIKKAQAYSKPQTPTPAPVVTKKAYSGKLPSTKVIKTNAEVINDTVRWALWIAGDNRFHYGKGKAAHHNGCFFCGTQPKAKKNSTIKDYKYTYCCNPFVGAAWAHGGCVPAALKLCMNGGSWGFGKNSGYNKSSLFNNLGHPAKSKLKKGDVLCKDTHVALYIGNGKIVEAGAEDDNVRNSTKWNNSIRVRTLTDSMYKKFKRVHRFNSAVNATITMHYGEVGDRVLLWQKYLNWYFGKKVVAEDGIYGDKVFTYTKKFQEQQIGKGQGDGYIGPKTIEAAKKVKK